jgi:hypothetical protein
VAQYDSVIIIGSDDGTTLMLYSAEGLNGRVWARLNDGDLRQYPARALEQTTKFYRRSALAQLLSLMSNATGPPITPSAASRDAESLKRVIWSGTVNYRRGQ